MSIFSFLRARSSKIFLLTFVVMTMWWVWLMLGGFQEQTVNYYYGLVFVTIPIVGGAFGLYRAWRWGWMRSQMGRAIMCFSIGLISWGVGGWMYSYYNFFLAVEAPYPSIADFIYLSSYLFWAVGLLYLSRVIGVKQALKKASGKVLFYVVPVLACLISYYILIIVARGGYLDLTGDVWKIFVDMAYPGGDIVMITLTVLLFTLSRKSLGGRYKVPVLILLAGFLLNYFADFAFAWQTTLGVWYVGNWVDFLYTASMTTLVLGITALDPDYLE